MNNLKTNIILWLSLSYAVFYNLIFWLAGYEATAFILAGLLFGLAFMVLVTWGATGWRAFAQGGREGEAILAFSLCIIAVYAVYTRVWVWTRLYLGNPEWMDSSPIGLGAAVLLLIFFTGVLFAPETKGGVVPRKNYAFWALAIFFAGCFIGASIGVALSRDLPLVPISNQSPLVSVPLPSCGGEKPVLVAAFCRARPNMTTGAAKRP